MSWTDEIVAELRRLDAEGSSRSQIRDALNEKFGVNLTRNAVIGKLLRIGAPRREQPTRVAKPVAQADSRGTMNRIIARRRYVPTKPSPGAVGRAAAVARVSKRITKRPAPSAPCSILELSFSRCGCVIGDPRKPLDPIYCGASKENDPNDPYCREHSLALHGRERRVVARG